MSAKDRARHRARLAAQLRRRRLRCAGCGARAEVDQRDHGVWVGIVHGGDCPAQRAMVAARLANLANGSNQHRRQQEGSPSGEPSPDAMTRDEVMRDLDVPDGDGAVQ